MTREFKKGNIFLSRYHIYRAVYCNVSEQNVRCSDRQEKNTGKRKFTHEFAVTSHIEESQGSEEGEAKEVARV